MHLRRASTGILALALVFMASLGVVANATEQDNTVNGVPLPVIPMAQGDSCVEDTDFMRRNHMDLLKHQRDETVKKGVRSEQHSLKECISCHALNGPDAKPVTIASPKHFCRSCHDYAAVSIDCFQCHASRPEPAALPEGHQLSSLFPRAPAVNGID